MRGDAREDSSFSLLSFLIPQLPRTNAPLFLSGGPLLATPPSLLDPFSSFPVPPSFLSLSFPTFLYCSAPPYIYCTSTPRPTFFASSPHLLFRHASISIANRHKMGKGEVEKVYYNRQRRGCRKQREREASLFN